MAAGTDHIGYERELGDHGARLNALEDGQKRIEGKIDDSAKSMTEKLDQNTRWLIGTAIACAGLMLSMVAVMIKLRG